MRSYAVIKAPAPLLPQADVTLGVILHDKGQVFVKFSHHPILGMICSPILAKSRFDSLQAIFSGTFSQEKFLTSRDDKGNIIELFRSDPEFLEQMATHWQDSSLRMVYGGTLRDSDRPQDVLDSLFDTEVLNQEIVTLGGESVSIAGR